jgi:hypothetical protein
MANCRSRAIKDPLPKELVMEAWKANVGCSFESSRTHLAYSNQRKFFDKEVRKNMYEALLRE